MKQNFLLKTMLLLCVLVGGVSNVWAEEFEFSLNELYQNGTKVTAKKVISTKGETLSFTDKDENFTILLTRNSGNQPGFYTSSGYFRFYSSDTFKLSAADGITITKIVVTSNGSSFSLSSLDGLDTSKKTWTGEATEVTFTGAGTNKWDKITITYSTGGGSSELADNDLALTNAPVALNFDLYNNNTAQVINYTTSSTGDISIDESDYATFVIDTVNKTVTVTPKTSVTPSAQTITVNQAEDETYKAGSVTFTVNITDSTPIPTYTVTLGDDSSELTQESAGSGVNLPARTTLNGYEFVGWSETNVSSETTTAPTIIPAGSYTPTANITLYPVYAKTVGGGGTTHESANVTISDYASTNKWDNGTAYQPLAMDANISVGGTISGNNFKYYSSDDSWRFYSGGAFTITASNGAELTSVTLTISGGTLKYNDKAITSGTAFDVTGSSAEISCTANAKITAISVNYDIAGGGTTYYWSAPVAAAVEMPSIVIAETPFLFSTTATITCETEGAAIKYSYDGENWNDYTAALNITATTTIYAKAVKGNDESSVAQATATKNLAEPTVTVTGDLTLDLDGETNVEAGTLTAAVTYNEAAVAGAVVTWTSSNTDVATINATTGAVTIKATGEVTFTATYAGNGDYDEATGTKTVTVTDSKVPGSVGNPYTVAQAITAIQALPNNNATSDKYYVSGIVSAFYGDATGIMSASSKRYYISDDGTTENQLLVYSGKGLNNEAFSSDDDLLVGDRVTIYGAIQNYQGNTPEIASGNYLTSRIEKPASDLTKTGDIILDFKNGATEADLTDYFTTSSTGAITYTVADKTVIENADELISALKVGITTVIVSQAATLSYKAGEITINVIVQDTRDAATTIPAINISTLKVGNSGTVSVTNPVKADEGVTFSYTSSNEDVLLIDGAEYAALAVGTATVTVTATPSNTNLYKTVVANFEVTVEADVKTNTEIAIDASGSTVYGTPKNVDYTITDGYDGEMSYIIDNAAIADVEIGASAITFTPKAVGTATITISAPATAAFNAAEDVQYTLTVTAPVGGTTAAAGSVTLFSETFDKCEGSGGRDEAFTGSVGSSATTGNLDEEWATIGSNGAYQCIKLGTGSASGSVTTSDITLTGTGTLTFSAAGWGDTKTNTIQVTATGCTLSGDTDVTLEASTWNTYTVNITDVTDDIAITFTMKRGFLDDVVVKNAGTDVTAKLNASGYTTYCSQYPLDFTATDGYTAWQIKSISGETITFEKITDKIRGGQGILLKGEAGATVTLASADSDVELSENLLFGTTAPTYAAADTYYGLSGNKFVKVNAGTIPAGKALLPASEIPAAARELTFVFDEGNTTGIKAIDNSQLTIDNYYDLKGRKVVQPAKGLYIKNGKKVVLK